MELRYYRRSAYLVDNFVHIQGISVYYPSPNRIALPRKMRDNRNVYFYFASFGLNLLLGGTTTLDMHHAFLNISLASLHEYDVKMTNFTFCGGREHKATTWFFYS